MRKFLLSVLLSVSVCVVAIGQNMSLSMTDFTMLAYSQVAKNNEGKNFVFSPVSVNLAMRMTSAGAEGKTLEQISNVVCGRENASSAMRNAQMFISSVTANGESPLKLANSLWVQKDYKLKSSFADTIKMYYQAECNNVDFVKKSARSKAISSINKWVSDNTNGKIRNIVNDGVITEYTRMVLANAVCFKCGWLEKFEPKNSRSREFYSIDGSSEKITFMARTESFDYAETDSYQAVVLPYAESRYKMIVLLPAKDHFQKVEQNLTSDFLAELLDSLRYERVELSLPKFKTETDVDFSELLKSMGIIDAFTDDADFSRMSDDNDLQISSVLHKSMIEVSENGTEAAAATTVIMMAKSAFFREVKVFDANRPFIYFLYDSETQTILFVGRHITA